MLGWYWVEKNEFVEGWMHGTVRKSLTTHGEWLFHLDFHD